MNEQNNYICPFRMIASAIRSNDTRCLGDQCAWWFFDENGKGDCVIHEIGAIHEDTDYIGYLMAQDR